MSDESIRAMLRAAEKAAEQAAENTAGTTTATTTVPEPRRLAPVSRAKALELLADVPFGRIIFTRHALPAIRVVNHTLVDGRIMIRTHDGAAITTVLPNGSLGQGVVVAYEADEIDPATRLGWSVVVTGYARLLAGAEAEQARSAVPAPWFGAIMDQVVCLEPELVTGMRMLPATGR